MEIAAQFGLTAYSAESSQPTSVLLSDITAPDKAQALFNGRRSSGAIANSKFHSGDHWQEGLGWIGAKPLTGSPAYSQTLIQIEQGFVSENVIKEVIDRHVAGILGREPMWGFLPADTPSPDAQRRRTVFGKLFNVVRTVVQKTADANTQGLADEADEALTSAWWNTRKVRDTLKKAVRTALLEERATLRFFFPAGLKDKNGKIPNQSQLVNALTIPQVEVLTSDKAGVFIDADTQQEFGVHVYKTSDEKDAACLTYVQGDITYLQIMVDKEQTQTYQFELGGRMLMYEITRDALITEQIRSLQKSLNLGRTMMVRNVNLAGSLERTIMNAERPKKKQSPTESGSGYREEDSNDYQTGAGAAMFLTGLLIRDEKGQIINRANPNIQFRDPVSTKTFTETRDDLYAAILSGCQQRHALISGDATASGRSREQARAEFESSLKDSKDVIDDTGRWLLETQLRLAALLCGRTKDFFQLRCDFNSIIETGPISPEERQANRDDVKARLMSRETAMSRNGIDDTTAEEERIAQDPQPVIDTTKEQGEQPPAS